VHIVSTQLDLFRGAEVSAEKPEPPVPYRLGKREARIPLKKLRRKAIGRLVELLAELEGKDIWLGSYEAGGGHFWLDYLKLPRLEVERLSFGSDIPSVIVLRGRRGGHVRIFTDYLVAVREQEYQGYWHYLLDFRNGFWQSPLDHYRSHYACLTITKFKE
jgi:hypothetical protein